MLDLSGMTYDAWLDFAFDHPAEDASNQDLVAIATTRPTGNEPMYWHYKKEWQYTCSAITAIANLTMLFQNPASLVKKYTMDQIEQGFWFIPGPNGFMWSILSPEVSFKDRANCIRSIVSLFDKLFCQYEVPGTSCYMWWDNVISYCVLNKKGLDTEMDVLAQVALTISEILRLECQRAKDSALHGVEHLIEMTRYEKGEEIKEIILRTFEPDTAGLGKIKRTYN